MKTRRRTEAMPSSEKAMIALTPDRFEVTSSGHMAFLNPLSQAGHHRVPTTGVIRKLLQVSGASASVGASLPCSRA